MGNAKLRVVTGLVALWGGGAGAAALNTLSDIKVQPTSGGTQVVVTGSRAPTFTVFRLSDPDRLVVDLSSSDASGIKGHHEGAGPVLGIVASQFSDEKASVGRVLVSLNGSSQYDVRAEGNRVVISVDASSSKAEARSGEGQGPRQARPERVQASTPGVANAPANTSPVTANTSPVSANTSPVPANTSPVSANTSPVTANTSPVSANTSPVTANTSPVTPSDVEGRRTPPEHVNVAREQDGASAEEHVVASRMDEKPVKRPAKKITAVTFTRDTLRVLGDGEFSKFELIELANPSRLVVDVYGVSLQTRLPKIKSDRLDRLRAGTHAGKVRIAVDAKGSLGAYRAVRTNNGLQLKVGGAAAPAPEEPEKEIEPVAVIDGQKANLEHGEASPLKAVPLDPPAVTQSVVEIKDLLFNENPNGGRIELKFSGEPRYKVERPDGSSVVMTLEGARLPKRLERSLDTSALDTPVKMISAFEAQENRVRVVVAAMGAIEDNVVKTPQGLSWRLSIKGVKTEELLTSSKTAGLTSEAATYAAQGAPRRPRYVGKKVSFEFKDIDIHNLLRVIAEISKRNIVVSDDVTGKVTIRLRNVPWDQALELILRSKGLGKEELGTIIRVAPLKTLEEESKLRAERAKAQIIQEPLVVQLIPVNYATAADMSTRVKEVLSERGNVTVDTRTNVLIVRDIGSNMSRARSLVQNLDTQTPQVLIESRIVEASTSFSRQIGVQWGGHAQAAPGTGNATGLVFPNTVAVRGGSTAEGNVGTADTPNFAVNLPAAVGTGSGGALGFVFGSAGGALALNLRISALENQGAVKTISAPKVTTLDNNTARISQGVSIPFSQVSASGVNTTFVEARLSLEVTPHITQDGSVLMNIRAENNQPDPSNTGANGQPAIQRKEANTQVLVKDGDTTVIGGIYVRRGSSNEAMVPLLGRIPLLGFFFRNHTEAESRQELLIFITPRIINRQPVAQNL